MILRVAVHLDKEYVDLLRTKDPFELLMNAINEECSNRLLVISDIMTSMQMTSDQIADFMAKQISQSIIRSRFYTMQISVLHALGQNLLWGYDLDKEFHLFLELCPNTSLLGHCLLKYYDALKFYRRFNLSRGNESPTTDDMKSYLQNLSTIMMDQVLSHKKQNTISVELLVRAHDCFVHECSMEGIAFVLQRCKSLTSMLTAAKSWQLIVRLLMGVGCYRDMYYCFETLIKNDQFESLLGQFDSERMNGLKDAVISYLREHHSDDREKFRLTALHFQMFKELAQMSENEAKTMLDRVLDANEVTTRDTSVQATSKQSIDSDSTDSASSIAIAHLKCSRNGSEMLNNAMESYAHAAEYYLLENKLGLAQRAASNAELIAMQIDLMRVSLVTNKAQCLSVLNIRNENFFRYLVNHELNVPQALILSRAYPYEIIWTEAIFNQFIVLGKDYYLNEFCSRMELSDDMIETMTKNFLQSKRQITTKMEHAISIIIEMVQSVTLRYKLASLMSEKRIIANLINGETRYYLKDTNYGRNERF